MASLILDFHAVSDLTVYLAALMGQDASTGRRRPVTAMLVTAAILVMGTFALALQSGQVITLLTNGGPGFSTTTLSQMIFTQVFGQMRLGLASAFASPALLLVILIGIGLVILMIAAQLRISILPKQKSSVPMMDWMKVVGIILMVLVLVGILFSILPYLTKWISLFGNPVGFFGSFQQVSSQPIFWKSVLNTWYVPILIVVLFQMPITVLAAIGIGGLRPLGKTSEWLLLIFAPWLLVTPVLLIPGYTRTLVNWELINSYFGLLIPFMMNIPLLVVLTLFYRGQAMKIEEKGETLKFFKDLIEW